MAKEIHEQAGALADTLLGRLVDGTLQLDERDIDESVLRSIDKIVVIACGPPPTPAPWSSTPSSTGAASPSRWSWPTSSATATPWSPRRPWWSPSPSPERPWTP